MQRKLLEHAPEVEAYVSEMTRHMGRMPPEERTQVHEELRQHLESLVAAHEEVGATSSEAVQAALFGFGDPKQLGRRYGAEWRRARRDPQAVSFAEGTAGLEMGLLLCIVLRQSGHPAEGIALFCAFALIVGAAQECRRPGYALCGAVYSSLVVATAAFATLAARVAPGAWGNSPFFLLVLVATLWLLCAGAGTYLAGAWQRGTLWYRYPWERLRLLQPRTR